MAKKVIIELPDAYDNILSVTAVGTNVRRTDVTAYVVDLSKGTHLVHNGLKWLQSEMETEYVPTNADRIRAMSDEELAMVMMCPNENGLAEIDCDKSDSCNCYECLLKLLQEKVEV